MEAWNGSEESGPVWVAQTAACSGYLVFRGSEVKNSSMFTKKQSPTVILYQSNRVRRTWLCSPTGLCCGDFRNTREPAENLQRLEETAAMSSGSADQYLMKEEKRVTLQPCLRLSVLVNSSPPFAFATCSSVFLLSNIPPWRLSTLSEPLKALRVCHMLTLLVSRLLVAPSDWLTLKGQIEGPSNHPPS